MTYGGCRAGVARLGNGGHAVTAMTVDVEAVLGIVPAASVVMERWQKLWRGTADGGSGDDGGIASDGMVVVTLAAMGTVVMAVRQ